MRAGKVQNLLEVSKPTLLRKVDEHLTGDIEKTHFGENIFRWKHIIKLRYLQKYGNKLPAKSVISICQNKGGVGKTTSVINLATAFSYLGKTLVIDLDSQANLSQAFNHYLKDSDISIPDVFDKPELIKEAIREVDNNLYLLPNHLKFEKALRDYMTRPNISFVLKKALKDIKDDYDFILIDTPPNLGIPLEIGLYASDYCTIPFQAQPFALDGILNIIDEIATIARNDVTGNFNPELLGVFVNNFEENTLFNQISEHLKDKTTVFNTKLRKAVAIPQSQAMKQSIFEYDENNKICNEYYELFFEIIERIQE